MRTDYYATKLSPEGLRRIYALADSRVRQYLQAEIDHLAAWIQPGDKILELGCGYGRVLAPLARMASTGWGIDSAPDNVASARDAYPDLYWAVMNAGSMALTGANFDLVFGVQNFISACKVPAQSLLNECLRVVKPSGRILLSSYAEAFWPHRLNWFRQQSDEGLLGPIDEAATRNGVIICTDGFKATTFSPRAFKELAQTCGVMADIYTVDDSSVFCNIHL